MLRKIVECATISPRRMLTAAFPHRRASGGFLAHPDCPDRRPGQRHRRLRHRPVAHQPRFRRPPRDGHQGARQLQRCHGVHDARRRQPAASSAEVTIEVSSIDTRNAQRDEHLRTNDFFDVAQFPQMTFKSTAVTQTGPTSFDVAGDLTIRGVTKPVTVTWDYTGSATDPSATSGSVSRVRPPSIAATSVSSTTPRWRRRRAHLREDRAGARGLGHQAPGELVEPVDFAPADPAEALASAGFCATHRAASSTASSRSKRSGWALALTCVFTATTTLR